MAKDKKKKPKRKTAPRAEAADDAVVMLYQGIANDIPPAELLKRLRETSTAGFELAEAIDQLRQAAPADDQADQGLDPMQPAGRGPRRGRRRPVDDATIKEVIAAVRLAWFAELEVKGPGAFASSHEALGVIEEEVAELKDAIRLHPSDTHTGKPRRTLRHTEAIDHEILDIIVGGLHALASRVVGGMDW